MLPKYAGPATYTRLATSNNAVVINGMQVPCVFYELFYVDWELEGQKNV